MNPGVALDAIVSPVDIAVGLVESTAAIWLPAVLIVAAIVVTVILVRKRKK